MEAQKKAKAEALARQKLGAGSGVVGLGDLGKDHAMKGQNVMVSSDEEEEEEEDDLDDLFGASRTKERRKIERPGFETAGLKPE
ncbi:DEAD-box type RNA helicase, partial [Teratosphaeriaceae sp. CCFEE 6253]